MSLENYPSFLLNFSEGDLNVEGKYFYRFKSFRLNVEERQLLKNKSLVPLTPKAFDVLSLLVERGGHLVEKDELLNKVWADSFVEEANIPRIVHTLRKTLGEDGNGNKFIETVAKKGYRFVADVEKIRFEETETEGREETEKRKRTEKKIEERRETKTQEQNETEKVTGKISEESPRRRLAASPRLILFTVGFLSAVFLIVLLSLNFRSNSSFDPNEPKSIAVLPLKSLTAENRNPIYEIGIADSLISKLRTAKNLVIRPLDATQLYADQKLDAIAAGKEQKVDFVLASNYQIADGKIRITSQLINITNGGVEEVFTFEQNTSNGFVVQDMAAANIGQAILKKLNRESITLPPRRQTTSEESYLLYLTGKALVAKRTRKDAEKAVEYLGQAVRLDPNYALAYTGLASAYATIAVFGGDKYEMYLKQKAVIEQALSIDENLSEAYSQLGEMKMNHEWDFDGAERAYKKAIELDPNSSRAHELYGVFLSFMGRADEAIAEIKIAIDLDPKSPVINRLYGQFLYFARRYDEAIVQLERTHEIDPNFPTNYNWLINSYKMKGEDDKAFEWFLRAPQRTEEPPERLRLWKEIYAKSGWRGITQKQIEDILEEDKRKGKASWLILSQLYADHGDNEQAIDVLQRGFNVKGGGWFWLTLKVNPKFDALRDDERFQELVRKVGLK